MANMGTQNGSTNRNQRVFRAFLSYIRKKGYTREDYPENDIVFKMKSEEEIEEAFQIIEKSQASNSEICSFYKKLIPENSILTLTPGSKPEIDQDWVPFESVCSKPVRALHQREGKTMLIFTPVDIFKVIYHKMNLTRSQRVFYGIQSILTNSTATYYMSVCSNSSASLKRWALGQIEINEEYKEFCPHYFSQMGAVQRKARNFLEDNKMLPPLVQIADDKKHLHEFITRTILNPFNYGPIEESSTTRLVLIDDTPKQEEPEKATVEKTTTNVESGEYYTSYDRHNQYAEIDALGPFSPEELLQSFDQTT